MLFNSIGLILYRAKSSINLIKSMAHLLFSTVECLNTSHVVSINSRLDIVRLLKQKKLIVYEIEIEFELHVMNLPANIL